MSVETIKNMNGGAFAARFGETDRPAVKVRFSGAGSKILDKFFNWLSSPSPSIVAVALDPGEPGPRSAASAALLGRYSFPPMLP